jgi:hypothetical protein
LGFVRWLGLERRLGLRVWRLGFDRLGLQWRLGFERWLGIQWRLGFERRLGF